uniref:Ferritin n=1 Tax=Riptortus pedestris TaxID=329032 RepID=R4WML0_RIPPE|nr:ferritin heavy chain protein [Riptortus pedestris]URS72995.1 ferritin light chain protein [Riptortus pedestris]BAN20096.1 ferritin 2 heavy chain homologue [Riptortus pedestris]
MKGLIIVSLLTFGMVGAEFCYKNVHAFCSHKVDGSLIHCTSNFSSVHSVMYDLESYVKQHLSQSFQYLLMSTNFGNYQKNREGLSKLYRKLSDDTWEDSIHLLKYITKRGGTMRFDSLVHSEPVGAFTNVFEMHELESLSRALDMSKQLANKAHHIHGEVTKKNDKYHDADTINFLEDKFVEKHTKQIRDLAGHVNDLSDLTKSPDPSLAIFLFDEYLKSIY